VRCSSSSSGLAASPCCQARWCGSGTSSEQDRSRQALGGPHGARLESLAPTRPLRRRPAQRGATRRRPSTDKVWQADPWLRSGSHPADAAKVDRKCFDVSEAVRTLYNRVHRHGLEPGDVGGLLAITAPGSLKANPSSLNN
jgi:hypothetical protein